MNTMGVITQVIWAGLAAASPHTSKTSPNSNICLLIPLRPEGRLTEFHLPQKGTRESAKLPGEALHHPVSGHPNSLGVGFGRSSGMSICLLFPDTNCSGTFRTSTSMPRSLPCDHSLCPMRNFLTIRAV